MSQQYFAAHPDAPGRPGRVQLVLADLYLELETDSGMFSPGRIDPGTRLLLETAPPPPATGQLLDLGCGYGPLALAMAARSPDADVWAVDVNRRALALCARNAVRAGLRGVRAVLPDHAALPGQFQLIWSNPPIRIGKPALHELLATWLARLAPGACGLPGGAAQPRGRLTAAMAGRLRLARGAGRGPGRISRPADWPVTAPAGSRRQLGPTDVKRLNRSWRRLAGARIALLLDSVSQPFNVGSIIRTAAALGVERCWLCGDTAPPGHPSARKTSLGTERFVALEREPASAAAAAAAARTAGFRVVAIELAADAVPLHEAPLHGDICLALGNEDHGCSAGLLAAADLVAYIPQPGRVGSLNVAAAAAIAIAETRRQTWPRA